MRDWLRAFAFIPLLLLLSACANTGKLREADLARIAEWLPGDYSNAAQVGEDMAAAVVDVHQPIAMTIEPIFAPIIGEQVYYVEQTDAMNPRRVLSQRLYLFEKTDDGKAIVQTLFNLKEPERWVGGHLRSDIFKSLVPGDVSALSGCDLLWIFDGKQFAAANSRAACRIPSRELNRRVNVEMRVELEHHELRISDRQFDAAGKLLFGPVDQPFYRFEKQ